MVTLMARASAEEVAKAIMAETKARRKEVPAVVVTAHSKRSTNLPAEDLANNLEVMVSNQEVMVNLEDVNKRLAPTDHLDVMSTEAIHTVPPEPSRTAPPHSMTLVHMHTVHQGETSTTLVLNPTALLHRTIRDPMHTAQLDVRKATLALSHTAPRDAMSRDLMHMVQLDATKLVLTLNLTVLLDTMNQDPMHMPHPVVKNKPEDMAMSLLVDTTKVDVPAAKEVTAEMKPAPMVPLRPAVEIKTATVAVDLVTARPTQLVDTDNQVITHTV